MARTSLHMLRAGSRASRAKINPEVYACLRPVVDLDSAAQDLFIAIKQ
jgi:hypothetical protein